VKIILNKRQYTEKALAYHELGHHPTVTLKYIARYFYEQGLSKTEIRQKLDEFVVKCNSNLSTAKLKKTLYFAVKNADKKNYFAVNHICVTKRELNIIEKLKSNAERQMLFSILCAAKYFKAINPKNGFWVNMKLCEIMGYANINLSLYKRAKSLRYLLEQGFIRIGSKMGSTGLFINFADEKGQSKLTITNFKNLGWQYLMYVGKQYFVCEKCGVTVKRKSNNQRFCQECTMRDYIKHNAEKPFVEKTK
jgi:hypothetical protein